jgi:hypothetical protein
MLPSKDDSVPQVMLSPNAMNRVAPMADTGGRGTFGGAPP